MTNKSNLLGQKYILNKKIDVRNDIRTSSSSLKHVMLQYFGVFQPSSGIMMTQHILNKNYKSLFSIISSIICLSCLEKIGRLFFSVEDDKIML